MPKHLKKLSEEILHSNPWSVYKHDTYEKPNGAVGDYYYMQTPGNSMIIPVLEDGRIVLILQTRYIDQRQSLEFPCGGKKEGQSPLDVAKIELYQETGWIADDFMKIGSFQALNGLVDDECHVFLAKVVEQKEQQLEDTEDIEVLYRRPDEIDEMIKKNDIWDGQTMAAWSMARHIFFEEKPVAKATALGTLQNIFDDFICS